VKEGTVINSLNKKEILMKTRKEKGISWVNLIECLYNLICIINV